MAAQRFQAVLEQRGQGAFAVVPFDVREAFGQARPPVRGTVAGHPFRTTVAVYGGVAYLGFRREVREAAGIAVGDTVAIEEAKREETRRRRVEGALAILRS